MNRKKLFASEIIRRLETMEKRWPDHLMLFAQSGTLELVDTRNGKVLHAFGRIYCDGGDEDHEKDEDGNEYMSRYRK